MTPEIVVVADVTVLCALWWCSFAGLSGGQKVRTWKGAILTAGLLGVMLFSFCGIFAIGVQAWRFTFWSRGLLYSIVVVALWLYDHRFGISKHSCMLYRWVVTLHKRTPRVNRAVLR